MTNQQYHRRRRALERLEAAPRLSAASATERDALRVIVSRYQAGGDRAKNGRGAGLHPSGAEA